jgi:hypothetical protein
MTSTVINRYSLTIHDVSTQIAERSISGLIKKNLPNTHFKINPGKPFRKYLL